MAAIVFLSDIGGLFELGESGVAEFLRLPFTQFEALTKSLTAIKSIGKANAPLVGALGVAIALLVIYAGIYALSQPRNSSTNTGLAYLLIAPAVVGVAFLIIYPFLFEIRLAFSNASLGTQATKNASCRCRL